MKRADRTPSEDEDDDEEANDPFAEVRAPLIENDGGTLLTKEMNFPQIEDSFTAFDVEANLIRDKHAMICGSISRMIDDLQASSPEEVLREASQGLVSTSRFSSGSY